MSQPSRIFITGATGFVGSTLVRHFAAHRWEVIANGRIPPPDPLTALSKYVQADIQKPIPRQAADVVVHTAALASDTAHWEDLSRANVDGTRHVFDATQDCKCFIFISSSSVYDTRNGVHQEGESVDYQKLSPYGLSKRMAEDWLLEQDWRGRSLFILRPRAIYGVGDRILLPRLLRLVRWGRILAPGEMRVQSSLTHVDNLCAAIDLCIHCPDKGAQIFNVADQQSYEMREVVRRLLSEIHGRELPFQALPIRVLEWMAVVLSSLKLARSFTPYSLSAVSKDCVLDIQKITQTLGYQAPRNFEESLPEIAAWVRGRVDRVREAAVGLPFLRK